MKQRVLIFSLLIILLGSLIFTTACGNTGQQTNLTSTSSMSTPAASTSVPEVDGNYTVRIGFPASSKASIAQKPPDVWALNHGFFDEEFKADGIKLEFVLFTGGGPGLVEALESGSLQMAATGDTGAISGKASGKHISLVAASEATGAFWLVVNDNSTIQKVSDLKGKSVSTLVGASPHMFLLETLKANEMQVSDIKMVNLTGSLGLDALQTGNVDAATQNGCAIPLSRGFRIVQSSYDLPEHSSIGTIIAGDSFIAAHPGFFPKYYRAYQKALDWANNNRSEAFNELGKNFNIPDQTQLEQLFPGTQFDYQLDNSPAMLAKLKNTEAFLFEQGLTRNRVDIDSWLDKSVAFKNP